MGGALCTPWICSLRWSNVLSSFFVVVSNGLKSNNKWSIDRRDSSVRCDHRPDPITPAAHMRPDEMPSISVRDKLHPSLSHHHGCPRMLPSATEQKEPLLGAANALKHRPDDSQRARSDDCGDADGAARNKSSRWAVIVPWTLCLLLLSCWLCDRHGALQRPRLTPATDDTSRSSLLSKHAGLQQCPSTEAPTVKAPRKSEGYSAGTMLSLQLTIRRMEEPELQGGE